MRKGMTASTVQAAADATRDAAEQLSTRAKGVIGDVEGLDWTGSDADKYKADFDARVNEAITNIKSTADGLANTAEENIRQQEQTSAQ